jgi:phospho-N-acetylmuramoyl-pentapeptide-transferase
MLLLFLKWLATQGIVVPQLFFYTTFKMLMCSISSFVFTLILGKVFIAKLISMKIGHRVRVTDVASLAASYDKGKQIPSMGGVMFIFTILFSCLLWMDLLNPFTFLLLFLFVSMGAIGFIDDYLKIRGVKRGLSARVKFSLQLIAVLFVSFYLHSESIFIAVNKVFDFSTPIIRSGGVEGAHFLFMKVIFIPFFKNPWVLTSSFVAIFFTIFVLIGASNAVNITDGLDGLATGCSLLVAAVFALIAFISNHLGVANYLNILYIEGAGQIAIFLCALIGGLLGFLWFNSFPAQVFMGDTGSLAIGAVLALAAVLLRREFLLGITGGIFVMETLSVILQVISFRLFGKRIFACAPIHHHFEIKGWHESKIVIRFWMIGLILAFIGLISIKIQ